MSFTGMIQGWFGEADLGAGMSGILFRAIGIAVLIVLCLAALYITRYIVRNVLHKAIQKTSGSWDNILEEKKVFERLTLFVPGLIIHFSIPFVSSMSPGAGEVVRSALGLYFIIITILVINGLLNFLNKIYLNFPISKEIPLTSFIQVIKIVLYFGGGILCIGVLLDKSPLILFSGLGAMTAVLLLVFKDPILGFVAGIQLISNKMLKHGDWIEMPKYGADGDVFDITLTTVKVRNWDKTITTIPTHALITDSYKNWRGMQESGGRRIKRAILIDMGTIKFCDGEMVERFRKIRYISQYIENKKKELSEYNSSLGLQEEDLINSRRLTNIGTFRAYVIAYLRNHPMINQEMTFLVRQLAPGEFGLPLEIYVFCKDKVWANYEAVQADIFDHLLATIPEFDLRVFQRPSGLDLNVTRQIAEG